MQDTILLGVLRAITTLFFLTPLASAQSPYAGDYLGTLRINETGGGRVFIAVDASGALTDQSGQLSGTVANNGVITYAPNDFGFTTSTIDGNFNFGASGSANNLTYRLEASKAAGVFASNSLDEVLTQTNPLNYFSDALDVIWDGSRFVALTNQSIAVSSDGQNWETRSIGITAGFTRIAFGNGTYVIVGDANVVASSTDLETWSIRSSGISGLQNFNDIVFFNGRFYALNIVKNYISSADGVGWTQEASFVTSGFGGFGRMEVLNGNLVAAYTNPASSSQTVYYTSSNGTTFTGPSAGAAVGNQPLALAFGGGVYLASSSGGLMRSTDASTWTKVAGLPATTPTAIAYSGSQFTARFSNNSFYTSPDGLTWTLAPGATGNGTAMAATGTTVVSVGSEPFYSTNSGSNWAAAKTNLFGVNGDYSVVAGNGVFILSNPFLNGFRTTDGVNFSEIAIHFDPVAYGNGIFAGYDRVNGKILYSVDGVDWYQATVIPGHNAVLTGGIAFDGERFYKNGLVSTDGITWDWASGISSNATAASTAGNGELIAFPGGPTYNISLDGGKTFTSQNNNNNQAYAAAYGNGIWVIGFSSGYYRYGPSLGSLSSGRYTEGSSSPGIRSMNFLGGVFYASLEDNRVIVSTDGHSWEPKSLGANVKLVGAAQSGPLGLVSGANSSMFTVNLGGAFTLPVIASAPMGTNVNELANVTLSATVSNGTNANYIWIRNGTPVGGINVSGENTPSLTITGIRADQAGSYRLIVTTESGGVISNVATVAVAPLAVFTTNPQSATVSEGGSYTFSTVVDDSGSTFQWYKNGVAIPGKVASSLALANVGASDAAVYTVVATNSSGPRTSLPAALSVSSGGGASLDTAFMANVPVFNASTNAMHAVAQQGNKLIVGGFFTIDANFNNNLMRLNADGTLDNTFARTRFQSGDPTVKSLGFDDQGRLYVSGPFQFPTGIPVMNANGTTVDTLLLDQFYTVFDFLPYGTTMTAVGNFLAYDGSNTSGGVGQTNTTTLDKNNTFMGRINTATTPSFTPFGGVLQSNGKLVVIGSQGYQGTNTRALKLYRFNTDGFKDTTFTEATFTGSSLYEVVVDEDDNIFVLGNGITAIGAVTPASSKFFKFGPNGALDANFGTSLAGNTNLYLTMAYVGDRTLVVGYQKALAISTEDGSAAPINFGTGPFRSGGTVVGDINCIQRMTDGFIIGGKFATFDGQPTNGIAYYKTSAGGTSLPLAIVRESLGVTERLGQAARFVVAATGKGLRYEWKRNGILIGGETTNQLHFDSLVAGNAGTYQVTVFDGDNNFVESMEFDLSIPDAPAPSSNFQDWAAVNLPGGVFTITGDANGNGQADGLDFILGSGARPSDTLPTGSLLTGSQLGIGGDEKYLTFSVRRRRGVAGLNVSPQASPTLVDLNAGGSNVLKMGSTIDGDFEVISYRATFSIGATGQAYFRIAVVED